MNPPTTNVFGTTTNTVMPTIRVPQVTVPSPGGTNGVPPPTFPNVTVFPRTPTIIIPQKYQIPGTQPVVAFTQPIIPPTIRTPPQPVRVDTLPTQRIPSPIPLRVPIAPQRVDSPDDMFADMTEEEVQQYLEAFTANTPIPTPTATNFPPRIQSPIRTPIAINSPPRVQSPIRTPTATNFPPRVQSPIRTPTIPQVINPRVTVPTIINPIVPRVTVPTIINPVVPRVTVPTIINPIVPRVTVPTIINPVVPRVTVPTIINPIVPRVTVPTIINPIVPRVTVPTIINPIIPKVNVPTVPRVPNVNITSPRVATVINSPRINSPNDIFDDMTEEEIQQYLEAFADPVPAVVSPQRPINVPVISPKLAIPPRIITPTVPQTPVVDTRLRPQIPNIDSPAEMFVDLVIAEQDADIMDEKEYLGYVRYLLNDQSKYDIFSRLFPANTCGNVVFRMETETSPAPRVRPSDQSFVNCIRAKEAAGGSVAVSFSYQNHANMLWFDTTNKIINRYDPQVPGDQRGQDRMDDTVREYLSQWFPDYAYLGNTLEGWQCVQGVRGAGRTYKSDYYCQDYSLLYAVNRIKGMSHEEAAFALVARGEDVLIDLAELLRALAYRIRSEMGKTVPERFRDWKGEIQTEW